MCVCVCACVFFNRVVLNISSVRLREANETHSWRVKSGESAFQAEGTHTVKCAKDRNALSHISPCPFGSLRALIVAWTIRFHVQFTWWVWTYAELFDWNWGTLGMGHFRHNCAWTKCVCWMYSLHWCPSSSFSLKMCIQSKAKMLRHLKKYLD